MEEVRQGHGRAAGGIRRRRRRGGIRGPPRRRGALTGRVSRSGGTAGLAVAKGGYGNPFSGRGHGLGLGCGGRGRGSWCARLLGELLSSIGLIPKNNNRPVSRPDPADTAHCTAARLRRGGQVQTGRTPYAYAYALHPVSNEHTSHFLLCISVRIQHYNCTYQPGSSSLLTSPEMWRAVSHIQSPSPSFLHLPTVMEASTIGA